MWVNVTLGNVKSVIRGESVPSIWKEALKWIEDQKLPLHELVKEGIILGSTDSGKRYAIALQPIHRDGRHFTQLHSYKSQVKSITSKLKSNRNPGLKL
ncbi:hypothetical protein CVD25_20880 [Bacillus canaveralius]|uniref:Uncharacterized protein n=1 Tax=Bacillus canaveralius TaxID=1403243 RepID=A0A2N5GK34_9BACI|nr:hypothetical protein CU635_14255 [Bacillus canaveralius]PLR89915.1 hypothetical protein CVD25_20880 [Bacillus canaveralius]